MNTQAIFGKAGEDTVETARVVDVRGEIAKVELEWGNSCQGCGSKGFCHPSSGTRPRLDVRNEINASIGDRVILETSPAARIGSSLVLFGLPILMMLVGTILGFSLGHNQEDSAVAGAISGLAFGLLLVHFINRFFQKAGRTLPRAIQIVQSAST